MNAKRRRSFLPLLSLLLGPACLAYLVFHVTRDASPLRELGSGTKSPAPAAENLCGPKAVYAALARLGELISERDPIEALGPSEEGTTFGSLAQYVAHRGYRTELRVCSYEELLASNTTAILWVDGDHFLTVDAREKSPDRPRHIRVYDVDVPAQWWSRAQTEERWQGETLFIRPKPQAARQGVLVVDSVLNDKGWIEWSEQEQFVFTYRNIGTRPLGLQVGKVGCGCFTASVSPGKINPGEAGQLRVLVNLTDKRGPFSSYVIVKTDHPALPLWIAKVACGVYQSSINPIKTLYLGDVIQGQSVSKGYYVHDRGDKSLEVYEARLTFPQVPSNAITPAVHVTRVENTLDEVKKGNLQASFGILPGDYRIEVRVDTTYAAPRGTLTGELTVATNLPDDRKVFTSTVVLNVTGDILVKPGMVVLSDTAKTKEIRVQSVSGRSFALAGPPAVSGDVVLDITPVETERKDGYSYRISAPPQNDTRAGLRQGEIAFAIVDGQPVRTEVLIYGGK